jgi:hypothetical protein
MTTDDSTTYESLLLDNNIVTASAKANQETVDDSVVACKTYSYYALRLFYVQNRGKC